MELRIKNGVLAAIQEYSSNDRERALVDYILLCLAFSREDFTALSTEEQVKYLSYQTDKNDYGGIEELKVEAIVAPKLKRAPSIRKPRKQKEVTE